MASTTTAIETVADALDNANPNLLPTAMQKIALGTILTAMVTEQADLALSSTSDVITLTKSPIAGTLRITKTVDGGTAVVLQQQLAGTSAIIAGCYKLSGTGNKTVTFKTGDYGDGQLFSASYIALDEFPTADVLAAAFA